MNKILFVCSKGKMRSKTAAYCLKNSQNELKFAGTKQEAQTHINQDMIDWSEYIICMEKEHYEDIVSKYNVNNKKFYIWEIPDEYEYMNDTLVVILKGKMKELFPEPDFVNYKG